MPRVASSFCVWVASILPLLWVDADRWWTGLSRSAWCALAWVVYAGLPRSVRSDERRNSSGSWALIALALPPLGLALRLDIADGMDAGNVLVVAAISIALALSMAFAAEACAKDAARARAYAMAWIALVPGTPFLCAALERGGATAYGRAPSWLDFIARSSPLGWIGREMSALGSLDLSPTASTWAVAASAVPPLCISLALLGLSRRAVFPRSATETVS